MRKISEEKESQQTTGERLRSC